MSIPTQFERIEGLKESNSNNNDNNNKRPLDPQITIVKKQAEKTTWMKTSTVSFRGQNSQKCRSKSHEK